MGSVKLGKHTPVDPVILCDMPRRASLRHRVGRASDQKKSSFSQQFLRSHRPHRPWRNHESASSLKSIRAT
jgi:hypothetical protein